MRPLRPAQALPECSRPSRPAAPATTHEHVSRTTLGTAHSEDESRCRCLDDHGAGSRRRPHRKETKTGVSPPFEQTAEFVLIGSAASGSGGSALAALHGGARPRARRPYRPQRPHVDGRGPVRQIALREPRHLWGSGPHFVMATNPSGRYAACVAVL